MSRITVEAGEGSERGVEALGNGGRLVRPERRGPLEGEGVIGVDLPPERRPGVPMSAPPPTDPEGRERPIRNQMEGRERTLRRAGLRSPTPVFGTAQPRHGASGALREAAYGIPEQRARHWMFLLLADRLDVVENRLGGALARPVERTGRADLAARVRENPLAALGVAALGAWIGWRLLRH